MMRTENSRNIQSLVPSLPITLLSLASKTLINWVVVPSKSGNPPSSTFPIATDIFAPANVTPHAFSIWFLASSHLRGSFLFSLQIYS
ncbi:hypothetical protein GLYMA_18G200700v4 [Glycine max]|uniref:Uncharacterized protein n=2 Tax=Glycine subgen. Soja TaxID=1462606 RepID=A0A0R0F211_SOYBN|nr:hypothetical protein GLYMA_18G200700v4 [Glycine max]RZB52851.1 hypothetical protein D0Y65_049058 [Glycine soja]